MALDDLDIVNFTLEIQGYLGVSISYNTIGGSKVVLHILEKQLCKVYGGSIVMGRNKKSVFRDSTNYRKDTIVRTPYVIAVRLG